MPRSELSQRVAVAAVGIPVVVAVVYIGRWAMGPALAFFCAGATLEAYRMAEARGVSPLRGLGAAGGVAVVVAATALPSVSAAAPFLWTGMLGFLLLLSLAAIWERGADGRPFVAVATTVFGALLPAGAMAYAIFLRHLPLNPPPAVGTWGGWARWAGVALVAYPLAITWITDSAAFFAGKRWGKRRLIPSVSPGKTVVGAVAGLSGGLIAGWVVTVLAFRWWLGIPLSPLAGAVGGILIGAVSQAGDLAESVWKREAGVKDSGGFFPGHGGILDRMDSLMFTIPAAYWWLAALLPGAHGW